MTRPEPPSARPPPLRIAVVTDAWPGPTETFVRRHVEALGADLVSRRPPPRGPDEGAPSPPGHVLDGAAPAGEPLLAKVGRRAREVVFGVPAPRWPRRAREALRRYLEARRPDVVLAEFGPTGLCVAPVCRALGLPLVVHLHGYDASTLLGQPAYAGALSRLLPACAAVVVVGRHMRERLRGLGCAEEAIHVIPCGAATETFRPSGKVGEQPCRFVAVGRFVAPKGPMETLRAFETARAARPEIRLTMIGDGPLRRVARAWARRRGLEHHVDLAGSLPPREVAAHLARSQAFVQHSHGGGRGAVEGWGLSIAEAAASGLPVVATRRGGIPDQVVDGETGFLVEPGDVDAMARRMVLLASDPFLRRRMGGAGRARVRRVGDATAQVARLRAVLGAAAKGGARRAVGVPPRPARARRRGRDASRALAPRAGSAR